MSLELPIKEQSLIVIIVKGDLSKGIFNISKGLNNIYTMSENIVQMSFLPITFFCYDLECSNLDIMLVMDLHIFVLI